MHYKIPVCLNGKDQLCDSRYEKRVKNPGDKGKQEKNYHSWFQLIPDCGWNIT
jgi:hypothetical protein